MNQTSDIGLERVVTPVFERAGEGPCPTVGCDAISLRYRIVGSKTVVEFPCDDCQAKAVLKEEREARQETVDRLYRLAGRTTRFDEWSFDSYPRDADGVESVRKARAWLALDPRPNLYLFGEVGTGKTGLAWSIARHLIEEELKVVRMVSWLDYLDALKDSYGNGKDLPSELRMLERTPFLIIDDLGAERPTEWALEQTATLVERRHRNRLVTITTSNYEADVLATRMGREDETIGRRIISRLTGDALMIRVRGSDRRRLAA